VVQAGLRRPADRSFDPGSDPGALLRPLDDRRRGWKSGLLRRRCAPIQGP